MSGAPHPIGRVLVANRGAVAARVIRTLRRMGLESVAVYSEADAGLPYVRAANQAVCIGPAPAAQSYLDQARLLQVARDTGADAVHPGYGFLSENAEFAEAVQRRGLCFIGPSPHWIRTLGHKTQARAFMAAQGMPQAASSAVLHSVQEAQAEAARIGFPVLVKPAGGGGGIGMLPAHDAPQLEGAWSKASGIAAKYFGTAELYLEKLIEAPRHIEFQVLADRHGEVRVLFERDCSVQRRHQKVVEEARPAGIPAQALADMRQLLAGLLARTGYDVIGTVEMLYTPQHGFVFLEMNTRLQVEHPVTELVTGIDLVAWQLHIAAGETLTIAQGDVTLTGHALEARVYAEDPERGFLPSTGTVLTLREATGDGVRVDSALRPGLVVPPDYDPMLAKVIAWGTTRDEALGRLDRALSETSVLGVRTNTEYLRALLADPDVRAGRLDTTLIERRLPDLAFRHPDAALLCAAALWVRSSGGGSGPWHSATGWRTGGIRAPQRIVFATSPSDRVVVLVSGEAVTVGGVVHAVRRVSTSSTGEGVDTAGEVVVEVDGITTTWAIARDGDTLWLGQDGFSLPLRILTREGRLREALSAIERESGPASPELRSPMPGTVVSVSVQDGDTVEAGHTVLTVEAMKMEHKLVAPVAGVVSITAKPGDLVRLDQILARITARDQEE